MHRSANEERAVAATGARFEQRYFEAMESVVPDDAFTVEPRTSRSPLPRSP